MAPTSTRQANERLVLDSAFFVAFELAHEGLKSGLHEVSCLNCTQYRVLVKLAAAEPEAIAQKDLGLILDLKPNVVTHAVTTLEDAGFAQRVAAPGRRGSAVRVLEAGIAHIERANTAIIAQLYRLFPTQTAPFRSILEAAVMAGAGTPYWMAAAATVRHASRCDWSVCRKYGSSSRLSRPGSRS